MHPGAVPPAQPRSPYRRLLANRAFLILVGTRSGSRFGDAFFDVALMWLVYTGTGSMLAAAGITVADRLAASLTNLVAGALTPALAYVAVFGLQVIGLFFSAAATAILPRLVHRADLVTAEGLFGSALDAAQVAGAAVAGAVVGYVGAAGAFLVDAVSFLLGAAGAASLPPAPISREQEADTRREGAARLAIDIREGWRTARSPLLWLSLAGASLAPLLQMLMVLVNNQGGFLFTYWTFVRQSAFFLAIFVGPLLFALLATYVLGRESVDGTLSEMLAVPIPGTALVMPKLFLLLGWVGVLAAWSWGLAALLARLLGLPEYDATQAWQLFGDYLAVGGLLYAALPLIGWLLGDLVSFLGKVKRISWMTRGGVTPVEGVFAFVSILIPLIALYLLWRIAVAVEAIARTRRHPGGGDRPPLP